SVFFFQAEDGIRDFHVTGVQTCALPISGSERMQQRPIGMLVEALNTLGADIEYAGQPGYPPLTIQGGLAQRATAVRIKGNVSSRSEERRVGKECRAWGWP